MVNSGYIPGVRVLHVTPAYPPTWSYGGVPRAVHGLATAQARLGADVHVWTSDALDATRRAGVPPRRVEDGVTVHVARNLSNRLAWHQQLYAPLSPPPDVAPDVVHLHAHRNLLNYRAWRHFRGVPLVHTPHGTAARIERKVFVKRAWDLLLDGAVPREAARVVAVSRAEQRQLVALGVPPRNIVHVPNGIALEGAVPRGEFRRRYRLQGPIVAYLGQITPRKGVDHLVAVFAGGRMPATLVVAGAPRGMAMPVAEGVLYTGTLEGRDRLALLADADVLAYPSAQEIFGLVPLEGLLCGTPVVVGDDCGCGEVVAEAGAGLLVPHGDRARLEQAIRALLGDRAAAAAMVERGRRYIAANLDFTRVARAHLDLYESLLG